MKKTKRKGLSFLELVIAMTLTFLSITFLMGLFITSIKLTVELPYWRPIGF